MALVTTVVEKMKGHTEESTDSAKLARKLQNIIGRPSTNELIGMIGQGKMQQFPIDRNNVYVAEDIFGPDVGIFKRKTTRPKTDHVENTSNLMLPSDIISIHKQLTTGSDIIYVNKLEFLVTISHNIKFSTCECP